MKKRFFESFILVLMALLIFASPSFAEQAKEKGFSQNFLKLLKVAQSGDKQAQYQVGSIYETGSAEDNVPGDLKKAREWYEKAASSGHTAARNSIAVMYYHGMAGLSVDVKKAVSLFEKSAAESDPVGTFMLGSIYYKGAPGVTQDVKKGAELIRAAADKGNPQAQDEVGVMYFNGDNGYPRDRKQAEEWYLKSAKAGYVPAQVHLGSLYYYGSSEVPKDEDKAVAWMKKAASLGNEEAWKLLEIWSGGEVKKRVETLELKKGVGPAPVAPPKVK